MPAQLINRAGYGPICNNNPQNVAIIQSMHLMSLERAGRLNDIGLDPVPVFPDISDANFGFGSEAQVLGIGYGGPGYLWPSAKQTSGWTYYCPVTMSSFAYSPSAGGGAQTVMRFSQYPFLNDALKKYPLKGAYVQTDTAGPYYVPWQDDWATTVQQIKDDTANRNSGKPLIPLKTLDGIVPYVGDRLRAYQLGMDWRVLAQQEKAATDLLLETQTPAIAAAISSQSVTNPLGTALLNRLVEGIAVKQTPDVQIAPPSGPSRLSPSPVNSLLDGIGIDPSTVVLPTLSGARANVALPIGISGNTLNQQQTASNEFNLALGETTQESYSSSATEAVNALSAQINDLAYWKANYPSVKIRPEQNPQIDRKWLYETWTPSMGPSPLVNVEITPRAKPIPTKGFLASNSWLAPIASLIPVVGAFVAVAVSIASAEEMKSYANSFQAEPDNYKPQYHPAPFNIILPLNDAKLIQDQPWYAENVSVAFVTSLNMAKLNQMTNTYNAYAATTQQNAQNQNQQDQQVHIPLISGSGNPRFSLGAANTPTSQDALATNGPRLLLGALALLAGR